MPLGDYSGRENQWTISSPVGGTTVTANYVLGTASGNTIVGIKNPHQSLPAYIKRAVVVIVTGTGVTGAFVWGVSPASQAISITSTGATGARNNTYFQQVTNGTATQPMQAFAGDTTNSVLAGSTAASVAMFRPFAAPLASLTAGNNYVWEETLDGEMMVGPGCFAGLFITSAPAGSTVVLASITFGVGA